ncbi:nineteen complex-related protein 2-domain-containing protein [Plectosphaerella plurivora]|uniref:Nineteen complex-related protein 2-domain-containing protein n=1 Tax=Plectosphaerella plurivora TaxID=936078 RepID=A0A9P8VKC0_9PEZI|nr:nineteen complex-related protein 2-domain-containing protein [Plectosphaerella plurivora]
MSSFGARRKARVIKVDDDEENVSKSAVSANQDTEDNASKPAAKFGKKPFRQSGLRKSININEDPAPDAGSGGEDGPVVVRPSAIASKKKRAPATRLSFGPGQDAVDTPKKPLAASAAARKPPTSQRLPLRRFNDDEEDRPRYNKEYLAELQSSTPNTPMDAPTSEGDPMELDPSELEGALIVESDVPTITPQVEPTTVLSATQIAERKQRRARLAQEQDFISLDDGNDDDDYTSRKKAEPESRLVREDEDLGEGFDDFVEDGGLSLGRKAEREANVRRRREMAEQIQMAEGNSDDESDDSDAERRAAFEAAQSRSGMDGLAKPASARPHDASMQVPAKITPLPDLDGCLERLRTTLQAMETSLQSKQGRVDELKAEREAIVAREMEVQGLLNEAGNKYKAAVGGRGGLLPSVDGNQSPAVQIQNAGMSELAVDRGLESFGTTPNRKLDMEE